MVTINLAEMTKPKPIRLNLGDIIMGMFGLPGPSALQSGAFLTSAIPGADETLSAVGDALNIKSKVFGAGLDALQSFVAPKKELGMLENLFGSLEESISSDLQDAFKSKRSEGSVFTETMYDLLQSLKGFTK